jgi:dipeptidyl aminopeptidase/acylaminoacyl peptidase
VPRPEQELLEQIYRRSAEIQRRRLLLRGLSSFIAFALVAGLAVPALRGGSGLPRRPPAPPVAGGPTPQPEVSSPPASPTPCSCTVPGRISRDPTPRPGPRKPSPGPRVPASTVLAFASDRDGNWEIYRMNVDGTKRRRLTNDPAPDREPAWSPDGKQIAFVRLAKIADLAGDIYVVNADGSGLRLVTKGGGPKWSPDGKRLAFHRYTQGTYGPLFGEVWASNADGSAARRVAVDGLDPAWAPDGSRIAFGGATDGITNVTAVALDGSGRRQITNNPAYACQPEVSPDGKIIAFIALAEGDVFRLEVIDWEGESAPRALTSGVPRLEANPSWSPDGRVIAIERDPDGDPHYASIVGDVPDTQPPFVVLVKADGSGEVRLTPDGTYSEADPAFAPRGL